MKSKNITLTLLFSVCICLTLACVVNVFLVSIKHYHFRSDTDFEEYLNTITIANEVIHAKRGNIYDANGEAVAYDITTYDIICYLDSSRTGINGSIEYVDDPLFTSQVLANYLSISQEDIYYYLTYNPNLYQTELGLAGRNLSEEIKNSILNYPGIHGIGFRESSSRYYPKGKDIAPTLIGYTLRDENGNIEGVYGLEKYLNDELTGENGSHTYQADKYGYILPGMFEEKVEAKDGYDVYTTIDSSIQQALNVAIENIQTTNNATEAWGAVMEIESGKILAWGQDPSYDPNELTFDTYLNYGSQYTYEPASTIKCFLWATAMDIGVYDGDAYFNSSEYYYTEDENGEPVRVDENSNYIGKIQNAGGKSWGMMKYDKALAYSSNVGSCSLLENYVGTEIFEEYIKKFGFFENVHTDGIEEANTYLNYNYLSEKLSLTYGQGSSFTMLQLLQGYSAIFGNGECVKPYFIDKVVDSNSGDIIYSGQREVSYTPIKEETARKMQYLLYRCVYQLGASTGYYAVDETTIIGKSGTAEIYINGEGYSKDESITSCMIAYPANNPKYMVYFAYRSPYDYYNHANSGTIQSFLRKVVILTNSSSLVKENEDDGFNKYIMEDFIGLTLPETKTRLQDKNINLVIIGNGSRVIDQYPNENSEYYTNSKIFIVTDSDEITIPDFTGFSRKDIVLYWQLSNVPVVINGYGTVYKQDVLPGTVISNREQINVYLQDDN